MNKYRFIKYMDHQPKDMVDMELPNVAAACVVAESFISPEADTFYTSIRFFLLGTDRHYLSVYKVERYNEPSENYGL